MNRTTKLFVLCLAALVAVIGLVPATYSWYSHNAPEQGKSIHYADSYELSIKTPQSAVTASTVQCDKNGTVVSNTAVTSVSVATQSVKYYKTTLSNSGTDDVMADFETSELPNNADFIIGTILPTLNEKAYASRAVRSKTSDNKIRVYFKTNSNFSKFWNNYSNSLDTTHQPGSSNTTTNDFNIAYTVGTTETMARMSKCPNADATTYGGTTAVYYYDIPSNANSFYFFNHWYMCSSSNREWNRTIDITDMSAGKLYYLTGAQVDGQWKEYKALSTDPNLVAVNSYFSSARMSVGDSVFADIGLKKESESEDEEFVPDYFGSSIAYAIKSGSPTNVVSVNKDGLLTPIGTGTTTIVTTITGKFGDTRTVETSVEIPTDINQVPIIKNVRIPKGDSVDIYWYALNKSHEHAMTTTSLYVTI